MISYRKSDVAWIWSLFHHAYTNVESINIWFIQDQSDIHAEMLLCII